VPLFLSIEIAFKFNNIWIIGYSLRSRFVPHETGVEYIQGPARQPAAEIPGMKKEEIHIDINEKFVTVSGEKKKNKTEEAASRTRKVAIE
jgi:hypothetical protein